MRLHPGDPGYNPADDLIEPVPTVNMLPPFAAEGVNAAQQHQSTKPIPVPDLDSRQQNQRNASATEWFNVRYDGPDWSAWITHNVLAEFGGSAPPGAFEQSRPIAAPPASGPPPGSIFQMLPRAMSAWHLREPAGLYLPLCWPPTWPAWRRPMPHRSRQIHMRGRHRYRRCHRPLLPLTLFGLSQIDLDPIREAPSLLWTLPIQDDGASIARGR